MLRLDDLPGSAAVASGFERLGLADPDDQVRVVIKLRPRDSLAEPVARLGLIRPLDRDEARVRGLVPRLGAKESDVAAVVRFGSGYGLEPVNISPVGRMVVFTGSVKDVAAAFKTELHLFRAADGETYRAYDGTLNIPVALRDVITVVAGLNDRRFMRRTVNRPLHPPFDPDQQPFTVPQMAQIYGFPAGLRGAGQRIAILEFGGGFRQCDLDRYFLDLGIVAPAVDRVSVGGWHNAPGSGSADLEPEMDIEIAGAIAPAAAIACYFASWDEGGWIECITNAVCSLTFPPSVISVSWGFPEGVVPGSLDHQMAILGESDRIFMEAAVRGTTIVTAAGDNGSSDGVSDGMVHVDFPASSPHVLACGGTTLTAQGGTIEREIVWNAPDEDDGSATGGGVSEYFAKPAWQNGANVPVSVSTGFAGRGLPDVAAYADLIPGYQVYVNGSYRTNGGTSAAAPLWAGLIALINERLAAIVPGRSAGYVTPLLYGMGIGSSPAFHDITQGNNGAYSAAAGWDACSGWGSPDGAALLQALTARQ